MPGYLANRNAKSLRFTVEIACVVSYEYLGVPFFLWDVFLLVQDVDVAASVVEPVHGAIALQQEVGCGKAFGGDPPGVHLARAAVTALDLLWKEKDSI